MHARSTILRAEPVAIDDGIAAVEQDVMSALQQLDGFVGLSLMVDRQSGRCIATSAWESQDTMRRSADEVGPVRDRAAERFRGRIENVQEWEIAVLHRIANVGKEGCARVSWMTTDPGRMDRAVDAFEVSALPRIEQLDGFCSASMLVDRSAGMCVSSVAYRNREMLDRTRSAADGLRTEVAKQFDGEILEVAEFELPVAHLRVPEMA